MMKKILLVDDHAIVRFGTIQFIRNSIAGCEILEAGNVEEMIALLDEHRFDLLILDINIPGGNNLQMIGIVQQKSPLTRILIFSAYDESLYGLRYLQMGVDGYLNKQSPKHEITTAISQILEGSRYIPAGLQDKFSSLRADKVAGNPMETLSNREMEVLQALIAGRSLAEIGTTLNVGVSTVSTYKQRIFHKLDISNMIELAEKFRLYSNTQHS